MNSESAFVDGEFKNWVQSALEQSFVSPPEGLNLQLVPLSGDAGFRCYFRLSTNLKDGVAMLAVIAPPATEDSAAFIKICEFLRAQGLRAPRIFAAKLESGFLLIEDLGQSLLLEHLNEEDVDSHYSCALMLLLRLQQSPLEPAIFPAYDAEKLRREMDLFPEWFVQKQLGLELSETEGHLIETSISLLVQSALEQPRVVVHRDFHSRNLVFSEDGNFGLIDFQDAVTGPVTYDLVSLLKDCYIEWPQNKVDRWVEAYAHMLVEIDIIASTDIDKFRRWFLLMGLQRHIKVLGIFCRLSIRDNKHAYLNDLPLVVRYVRAALKQVPELDRFCHWFETRLIPEIEKQSWMQ